MSSSQKKDYQYLLQGFFPRAGPELQQYLETAPLFRIHRGRALNLKLFEADHQLCLLNGMVAVMLPPAPPSGKPTPLIQLSPGQLLASETLRQTGLLWVAVTDEVILCPVPEALILSDPDLVERRELALAELMSAMPRSPQPAPSLESSPNGAEPDPFSEEALLAAPIQASVQQCLRHLLSYSPPLKDQLHLPAKPESFEALCQLLKSHRIPFTRQRVSWQQLLGREGEQFPLIIEGPDGFCHWVVGVKGHSLHELWFGRSTPLHLPEDQAYEVLVVAGHDAVVQERHAAQQLFTMGWYLRFLLREWFLTAQMVLASILVQVMSLGIPIFSMIIFDRVFGRQNLSTLNVMTVGIVIIVLAEIGVKTARTFILTHQMMALDRMATQALLRKLKEAPIGLERRREAQETPGSANGKGSSKAQARQNQLRTIPERLSDLYKANQTILSMWLKHGLDAGFSVLLMVVLFFLNVEMAVVSLLPLIPIAIEALWVAPKRRKSAAAAFKKNRETQLVLTEYLIQAETIQSLYAEEFWNRNVLQKINQTMRSGFGERFERTGAGNVQGFFGNLGSVLALFVGAHEVLEGKISFGAYLAISMLSRQVVAGCQKFLTASGEYQEATETVKVFRELAVEEETSRLQQGQTFYLEQANGELRLVNLHYRYDTDLPWVLSGLSCTVPAGLKIVLVGRSGSGKTTLIRLLQRFYQPSQGYICLDNINLLNLDLEGLRQCIGVVPQKPVLFSGTLYDNLVMGNPLANLGDILDVLKLVELDEEIMAHPKGLEAEVFPFGSNYSGGQAARLALARVLLKQPSVLVLDEALSQVEPALQVRIYQRILQLYHDKTVILVTDSLPIHQQVDAIVVMHEGRLVEAGTYRDLVQANGLYCKLFQPPPLVAATPSSSAPGASPA